MSLKAFHVVFIILAVLVTAGFAVWCFVNRTATVVGVISALAALALAFYGIWFVRKSRNIIT